MKKSSLIVLGLRVILLGVLVYFFWCLIPSGLTELNSFLGNKKQLVDTKIFKIIIGCLFFGFAIATGESIYNDRKFPNKQERTILDLYKIYFNYFVYILICSLILHYVATKIDLSLSCGLSLFIGYNIDKPVLKDLLKILKG
tara:strand:- start:85 stop:510 length:426 start_codon:yes stop_codon:yes gene_type:complete